MTYPKRIEWHGGSSGHPESRTRVSQRALVEASLLRCPPRDGGAGQLAPSARLWRG